MLFWFLAFAVTAVACAALYYAAARRRVNAAAADTDPELAHFRLQLKEIEADTEQGRMAPAEALAARGELAREVIRVQKQDQASTPTKGPAMTAIAMAVVATAGLAFGTYAYLGSPDLPAEPLASRADLLPKMTVDEAIAKVEQQLQKTPDDARGWAVLAPVYMHAGRYQDAANAFQRVIDLTGPTAQNETDLGEALMMVNGGKVSDDALKLFKSAAARDPTDLRSRYYIAGRLTQSGDFEAAVPAWQDLLDLARAAGGSDDWVQTAEAGLQAARTGLNNGEVAPDPAAIRGMVDGLSTRLMSEGGSVEDWTKLVRSRLVLGQTDLAQDAYDKARAAYPDASVRTDLDVLAADNGLVAND